MSELKRTWAEINLDNLAYNYAVLRSKVGENVKIMGIVKADAYGHGAVKISKAMCKLGFDYLAVSSLDEAQELRFAGIDCPLLILGHTPPEMTQKLISLDITQTVTCLAKALEYSREAEKCNGTLKIHIKLDTGMSRLGFLCAGGHFDTCIESVSKAVILPNILAEGIFTHFSVSDEMETDNEKYTREQFDLFMRVVNVLSDKGHTFAIRHCANSGAVANYPETYLDMVRPGILSYGYGESASKMGLRPVMSEKTVIGTIKVLDENTSVSYGRTYKTDRKTTVGVLPVGYADGLFRSLSNCHYVHTRYGKAKIIGRICMDMCMIDLSRLSSLQVGDEVEIFGEHNPIEAMAERAGTIPYEIICAISKRVPRIYIENGKVIERELNLKF